MKDELLTIDKFFNSLENDEENKKFKKILNKKFNPKIPRKLSLLIKRFDFLKQNYGTIYEWKKFVYDLINADLNDYSKFSEINIDEIIRNIWEMKMYCLKKYSKIIKKIKITRNNIKDFINFTWLNPDKYLEYSNLIITYEDPQFQELNGNLKWNNFENLKNEKWHFANYINIKNQEIDNTILKYIKKFTKNSIPNYLYENQQKIEINTKKIKENILIKDFKNIFQKIKRTWKKESDNIKKWLDNILVSIKEDIENNILIIFGNFLYKKSKKDYILLHKNSSTIAIPTNFNEEKTIEVFNQFINFKDLNNIIIEYYNKIFENNNWDDKYKIIKIFENNKKLNKINEFYNFINKDFSLNDLLVVSRRIKELSVYIKKSDIKKLLEKNNNIFNKLLKYLEIEIEIEIFIPFWYDLLNKANHNENISYILKESSKELKNILDINNEKKNEYFIQKLKNNDFINLIFNSYPHFSEEPKTFEQWYKWSKQLFFCLDKINCYQLNQENVNVFNLIYFLFLEIISFEDFFNIFNSCNLFFFYNQLHDFNFNDWIKYNENNT